MNGLQLHSPAPLQPVAVEAFDELTAQVARSVSASSARVYGQTYASWRTWCVGRGVNPLELRPSTVTDFLSAGDTTKATRQRQLSALRKLAEMLYILAPADQTRQMMEALKVIKAPVDREAGAEREGVALTPAQADRLLRVWHTDDERQKARNARNRALVAVLLMTGIRRAEAAALRWRDVDFENGVLKVRHGKGDKAREVPVAGDLALDELRGWQLLQGAGREWVFCAFERGGHLGKDKPIVGNDVYRIVDQTGQLAGVEWHPHDGRRTFITEALATGAPLATVQAAAGHAQGATTLRYARSVDARRARKELRLRYGG